MPILLLEGLPLPNLTTYTTLSVLLLACSLYYSHNLLLHPETSTHEPTEHDGSAAPEGVGTVLNVPFVELFQLSSDLAVRNNSSLVDRGILMVYILTKEPWCLVTLINMSYCCLVLFGRLIQKIVFGQLRAGEQKHIKDKFWNFVFYKFIFIFGVMNVQEMQEIVLWSTWFSILGFLHILAQLCKDRFEYLSSSPATTGWTHCKVLLLLLSIHIICVSLLVACVTVGLQYTALNTFAFVAAECLLLTIRTLYVLVRYGIHLCDMRQDGVWENRSIYIYYSELFFELSALSVDFCHHLHMLLWGNIFLSMASLVICMQLRYLFYEFQRRIKRYKNYRRVVSTMEAKFPVASTEELQENNDGCAICWERMESARKLPCNHMFHKTCLRSWLEQDTSCPTCRISLNDLQPNGSGGGSVVGPPAPQQGPRVGQPTDEPRRRPQNRTTDRFHFDGSRYVSWLPSFSVEVTHMQLLGNRRQQQQVWTSQLDSMARSVQEVFPNIPTPVILDDLRITHSVEVTIENIVEGRLQAPPIFSTDSEISESPPFVGDLHLLPHLPNHPPVTSQSACHAPATHHTPPTGAALPHSSASSPLASHLASAVSQPVESVVHEDLLCHTAHSGTQAMSGLNTSDQRLIHGPHCATSPLACATGTVASSDGICEISCVATASEHTVDRPVCHVATPSIHKPTSNSERLLDDIIAENATETVMSDTWSLVDSVSRGDSFIPGDNKPRHGYTPRHNNTSLSDEPRSENIPHRDEMAHCGDGPDTAASHYQGNTGQTSVSRDEQASSVPHIDPHTMSHNKMGTGSHNDPHIASHDQSESVDHVAERRHKGSIGGGVEEPTEEVGAEGGGEGGHQWMFSNVPSEREEMLSGRKKELLFNARRRYLNKMSTSNIVSTNLSPMCHSVKSSNCSV